MTSVGVGCETPTDHAESATIHALLNCYLSETGDGEVLAASEVPEGVPTGTERANGRVVGLTLSEQSTALFAPLRYESPTGRHLFDLPVVQAVGDEATDPLDAATLAALLRRELVSAADCPVTTGTDLLRRVLLSHRATAEFVAARDNAADHERLYGTETNFRDAEQSLVYGHHRHPTPKSREGIAAHERSRYAPELRGGFQLRYVAADPEIVSSWDASDGEDGADGAASRVESILEGADDVPPEAREALDDDRVIVPVHPWQADHLQTQPHVRSAVAEGDLTDLGSFGPTFHPTSSVRTLWSDDAPYMVKGSLAVQITNAERTNKRPELRRGVAVSELLATEFGDRLAERFPRFDVIEDPAALTLDIGDGAESGFEVILRENPFRGSSATNVTPVVGLCQDGIDGPSRAARIVADIAERTGREQSEVAREWFREYLAVTVRPVLWAYFELGVGVEAHQQNTLVRLDDDGWPEAGFYRDNQGYYFPESRYDQVDSWLPGVGERADTICPDALADERLRYYILLNNALGVVNALGLGGVADETELLRELRDELDRLADHEPEESDLVSKLLSDEKVPCKGNLLTRFEGLDELENSIENQSVYTEIENPLVTQIERKEPTVGAADD